MITIKKSILIFAFAATAIVGGVGSQVIVRAIGDDKPACAPVGGTDFLQPGKVEGTGADKEY